jgi:hypothetical protein
MCNQTDSLFLAWQGVKLRIPVNWEPSVLDPLYLRLECDHSQILDVKWNRIKGPFEPRRYLQRMIRSLKSQAALKPDFGDWEKTGGPALAKLKKRGLKCAAFCWQEKKGPAKGPGAVAFNPKSRRAMVLFFSPGNTGRDDSSWAGVLASLKDQSGEDHQDWAVFDLNFRLPAAYKLKQHNFRPGHFQLSFEAGSAWLVIERLGPADVLLNGGDITQWAEDFYKNRQTGLRGRVRLHTFEFKDTQAFEWETVPKGLLGGALPRLLAARAKSSLVRIWRPKGSNKLLVVRQGVRGGLDRAAYQEICEQYGVV